MSHSPSSEGVKTNNANASTTTTSTSRFSKLRAKSKSFFRREPRAVSADTRHPLVKRHSSHEPLYGNIGCINNMTDCNSNTTSNNMLKAANDCLVDDVTTDYSNASGKLYRSQSKYLDSDYLMEEIAHSYRPNTSNNNSTNNNINSNTGCRRRLSTSMSMGNFSRSVFDLRNNSLNDAGSSLNLTQGCEAASSARFDERRRPSNCTITSNNTMEGKKKSRGTPLRKLLSCDSSAKMRSQSICVPRSLPLDPVAASPATTTRIGSSRFYAASPLDQQKNCSGSRPHVPLRRASHSSHILPASTPTTTASSCKQISGSLIQALSLKLKNESIDLTTDPYSDVGGFCGIPAALVQRYSEELGNDVYDVADAMDHMRMESLLLQGRRGVSFSFPFILLPLFSLSYVSLLIHPPPPPPSSLLFTTSASLSCLMHLKQSVKAKSIPKHTHI